MTYVACFINIKLMLVQQILVDVCARTHMNACAQASLDLGLINLNY